MNTGRTSRLTAFALVAAVAVLCGVSPATAGKATLPNLALNLAADLDHGDIGPSGSTVNHTPNLDQMARAGMDADLGATNNGPGVRRPGRVEKPIGLWLGQRPKFADEETAAR